MNLFDIAVQAQAQAETRKRGNQVALASTITVPHFKGLYRKGEEYRIQGTVTVQAEGKKPKARKVDLPVKPLTGAFVISYCSCLAQCIVSEENTYRRAHNSVCPEGEEKPEVVLSTYLVQAVLQSEGFDLSDYKQGKTTGARRIEAHLKALAKERKLPVKVNNSVIEGLSRDIVNDVLTAI